MVLISSFDGGKELLSAAATPQSTDMTTNRPSNFLTLIPPHESIESDMAGYISTSFGGGPEVCFDILSRFDDGESADDHVLQSVNAPSNPRRRRRLGHTGLAKTVLKAEGS